MNILFTVCGRAGSKGFKNKNLKDFLGHPLIYFSLSVIDLYKKQCGENDRIDVVLNTDSPELIKIANAQDMICIDVIEREENLGGDSVPKVSVIKDCLVRMSERNGIKYDVVVDLDITSPIRTVRDVRNAIERKIENREADVVYSVTGSRRNPYFNMVKKEGGFFVKAIPSNYTARQQAPEFYDMNASIYAYSPDALMYKDHATFFNDRADAIIMKDTGILDIDSEEDYELISVIAKYFVENDDEYGTVFENVR